MASGELDPLSGVPLYRQIKNILRTEVVEGAVDPGKPMTEELLLNRFRVSRAPIRQALKELTTEGYVYRRQGKGTFPVAAPRVLRPAHVRTGDLYHYLSETGLHPASAVSSVQRVRPTARMREVLSIDADEDLLHFTRVISVENEPLLEAKMFIRAPADFAPTVPELESSGSGFELLERDFGITLGRAEHESWATAASSEHAAALAVPEESPLLVIETVFYTTQGIPAGWRSAVHRADRFKYRFITSR